MPFLALTTTPSMAPSAAELTLPVSAVCACALAALNARASAAAMAKVKVGFCISFSPMAGGQGCRPEGSVERFDLDEVGAVIAADPERHRRRRIVDEHAADVGGLWQQILHERPGLGIEPNHP